MKRAAEEEVLQAYLDGALPPAETTALETRLCAEPELAEALLRLAHTESVIVEWAQAARYAAEPAQQTPRKERRLRHPVAAYVSSAAAAIVLGLLAVSLLGQSSSAEAASLARLEEVQGEVSILTASGVVLPARSGQRLFADQELRTGAADSFAVVHYEDDTRLEVSPHTTVRLATAGPASIKNKRPRGKRLFLKQGVVTADVVEQPGGEPFILATPHAEIKARHGAFSSASDPEATQIELEEGRLELLRKRDGQTLLAAPGSYTVDAAGTEPLVPRPLAKRLRKPRALLKNAPGAISALAYALDGKTLALGGRDGSIRLCDPATGQVRSTLRGHAGRILALAFSPDGRRLASASNDNTARLWELSTGREQALLRARKHAISSLAFTPDGKTLLTGGWDGGLRLWDLPP